MLCCSSAGFTTFTPLSVRFTTSGCSGITGAVCCEERSVGTSRKTAAIQSWYPVRVTRYPRVGASLLLSCASLFPLPSSLFPPLESFQQRVVARRGRDALDEPFHGGAGRHLL